MENKLVANNVILEVCPQFDGEKSRINQNVKILHLRKIEKSPLVPLYQGGNKATSSLIKGGRGNLKSAFSLVELIVVIAILAILGTISFIYFQGYSKNARDTKRISDVKSLLSKVSIETTKGVLLRELIANETGALIKINGNSGVITNIGIINFENLKENQESFQDPLNKEDYKFAFSEGVTSVNGEDESYKFMQIATINEVSETTQLVGNYYEMQPGDSPSLFVDEEGNPIESGLPPMIYNPGIALKGCLANSDLNGYSVPDMSHGQTLELEENILNGKKKATFKCNNGILSQKGVESIECELTYSWDGDSCEIIPTSCPAGRYLNGNSCIDVGYGNYSPANDINIYSCPDGGTTSTTTASVNTECKKLSQSCVGKPSNSVYNTATSITQTYNGMEYVPSVTAIYNNVEASTTECRYKCSSGYKGSDCSSRCVASSSSFNGNSNYIGALQYCESLGLRLGTVADNNECNLISGNGGNPSCCYEFPNGSCRNAYGYWEEASWSTCSTGYRYICVTP